MNGYHWEMVAAHCRENVEGDETTREAVAFGYFFMSIQGNGDRVEDSGKE